MNPSTTSNFMVLADPQFGIAAFLLAKHGGRTTPGYVGESLAPPGTPAEGWPYEAERLDRAVAIANRVRPDFVVVLGDMVMNWDNADQRADVLAVFEKLSPDIPVRWVPGNHDVGVDFFSPTTESIASYAASFGPDHYSFTHGSTQFVVINSALLDKPESAPDHAAAQFEWLEAELRSASDSGISQTILFAHHPPFLRRIDEDHTAYNLPHTERRRLVDLLLERGVEHMFTGHTHANYLARHGSLKIIATSAVGVSRYGHASGYRLVKVAEDSVSHSFYALP